MTDLENCDKCSFRNIFTNFPIVPECKKNVELMVVEYSPSKEEDITRASFFDRHNKYIKTEIGKFFNDDHVYYTYLVKCFNTVCPSLKKIKPCKTEYLDKEIDILKPKGILYLGSFLAKMHKENIGTVGLDNGIIKGFWNSSFKTYTSGKHHLENFHSFLFRFKKQIEEKIYGMV